MDLLSGDFNASVLGWSMIMCGLVTGLLNGLIARSLSESPRKGVIVGLGVGLFLSLLAPFFCCSDSTSLNVNNTPSLKLKA